MSRPGAGRQSTLPPAPPQGRAAAAPAGSAPGAHRLAGNKRRLDQLAAVAALAMQVTLWLHSAASLDLCQHMRQAASVALQLAAACLAFLAPPQHYCRLRVGVIALLRIAMAAVPNNRATQEGLALLLERPATPGLMGAAQDYLRIASGTRLLAMVLAAVVLQQPPLAVLLQQCAVMLLTAINREYCGSRILSDPLTQRRMASLWAALEWLPNLAPPHAAAEAGALIGPPDSQHLCVSLLNMHQLVCGILLPTLLAAYTEQRYRYAAGQCLGGPDEQPEQEGEQPEQELLLGQQPGQQQAGPHAPLQGGACPRAPWPSRLLGGASRAWEALDAGLQGLCLGAGICRLQRLLAVWVLLGNLWLVSRALTHGVGGQGLPARALKA